MMHIHTSHRLHADPVEVSDAVKAPIAGGLAAQGWIVVRGSTPVGTGVNSCIKAVCP